MGRDIKHLQSFVVQPSSADYELRTLCFHKTWFKESSVYVVRYPLYNFALTLKGTEAGAYITLQHNVAGGRPLNPVFCAFAMRFSVLVSCVFCIITYSPPSMNARFGTQETSCEYFPRIRILSPCAYKTNGMGMRIVAKNPKILVAQPVPSL